jgi:tRNA threonylcarbamoyladenosine biosynthesis protein TsaB
MNILAVDTSTESLSVAFAHDEQRICLRVERGLGHAVSLLPWIDRILSDAGLPPAALDLLVCTVGPGSFTGIRIGIATIKGLSVACDLPAVGICTLDVFAWPLRFHAGSVIPVIDARKGRFYAAVSRGGAPGAAPRDLAPADLRAIVEAEHDPILAGPDAEKIRARMGVVAPACTVYDPSALLQLGLEKYRKDGPQEEGLSPLYLRQSEAERAAAGIAKKG